MKKVSVAKSHAPVVKQEAPKFDELGATGLRRTGSRGLIIEEFLSDLSGIRAIKIYREMRDNDPTIGAMFFAIESLIKGVEWRVEGKDTKTAEFITSCMEDMSTSWTDVVTEALSMLTYGWSWHEVVYKRRVGPDDADPAKRSRYTDGKIGWRKMPIRSQDSMTEWVFDDTGSAQAMVQQSPPSYATMEIPISRSLLFRVGQHKGNPEGRSLLRNAYRSWYFKRRIEEIEAIGVERDLAGLPVMYRSPDLERLDNDLKNILRNVRRDEQEGMILPLIYDEGGHKQLEFSLLSSAGSRQLDTTAIIDRYDKRIAMTVMSDFLLMGQSAVGSFALASSKTELFAAAIGAVTKAIADVLNRYAIPRLLAVNGMPLADIPQIVPGDLETPDLGVLGAFITALSGAGAPLFPDDKLENHLRKIADLPAKPEEGIQPMPKAPVTPPQPKGALPVPPPAGKAPVVPAAGTPNAEAAMAQQLKKPVVPKKP